MFSYFSASNLPNYPNPQTPEPTPAAVNALGGIFISVTGIYYALKDLSSSGQFLIFHEESCKEGSYFWGNDMWDHPVPNTSLAYTTLVEGCCNAMETCGE